MGGDYLLLGAVCALFTCTWASVRCGDWICSGPGAYCCDDTMLAACCYQAWTFWWFWMFWVFLFIIVLSCGFWCRRRYRRTNYVVIRRPDVPVYGATSLYGTSTSNTVGDTYVIASSPTEPTKPPAYSEGDPPAYTATS